MPPPRRGGVDYPASGNAFRQNGVIEEVAKMQMDLGALSFACGANRVAPLQAGDGTDHTRYAIPKTVEWHTAIDRIRMETFKYLLDRWVAYDTPDGPLLDNGFVMWTNHISSGPSHSQSNLPIIIAGSPSGFLEQGAYIDAGGVSNAMVMNTLFTPAGIPTDNFGSGGTGMIDGMLA